MRLKNALLIIIVCFSAASCVPYLKTHYQVCKVQPQGNVKIVIDEIKFENNDCIITYNFWSSGGKVFFSFFNKTDNNIYINKNKSFIIINGLAKSNFRNKEYTALQSHTTTSSGTTSTSESETWMNFYHIIENEQTTTANTRGKSMTSGTSVTYKESEIICVPPSSYVIISEYTLSNSRIIDCALLREPRSGSDTKQFNINDSPLVFKNRITYAKDDTENDYNIENDFFISEITNYSNFHFFKTFFDYKYEDACGNKTQIRKQYFKKPVPHMFYLQY